MKFLIIAQDLRPSGTSEGIVSRSFIAKIRRCYPDAKIDVVNLKTSQSDIQTHLLPVNSIEEHVLNLKVPIALKLLNKFYWRIFHLSLYAKYIQKKYSNYISKINYHNYDHIFIRSSGLDYELLLGCRNLPLLKKAIINFHDPYPLFWYPGSKQKPNYLQLISIKEMFDVISQAKTCTSPSSLLSNDLSFLFGSRKKFHTLPHQFVDEMFDLPDNRTTYKKEKKLLISYQGALMFGRNIDILLDSYINLLRSNIIFQQNTEFVIRIYGDGFVRLQEKYKDNENIKILHSLNFAASSYEQINDASINVILENGPLYSNTLVGKAPFLASTKKPIFILAPGKSELRQIVKDQQYIASYNDAQEIERKLLHLINVCLNSHDAVYPFGDYFSDRNFKENLENILVNSFI